MYETIKNFSQQFLYEPEIENKGNLAKKTSFIVAGMGGSALAAKLLKVWKPDLDIINHTDYGLPKIAEVELAKKLVILSSYSGNTEETLDAFNEAKAKNLDMAVIATGGKLLSLAIENKVPYVKLPDTGIQPRMSLGLMTKALLKLIREEDELINISKLAKTLNDTDYEKNGKALAEKLKNFIPVIYSSNNDLPIAYNWKIKFNETGKIPAFYNVFSELNHNEMTGFDVKETTKELCNKFYFIILKDGEDNPKILKRMEVLQKLYQDRNLKVETLNLNKEKDIWHKIFSSLLLADWTAYYTAKGYGLDPEQVPMVEEFKKLILE
jgi:glucose/mannose-6-phosphate isomerase